ncbi:MAG: PIN domain-containing protein, partial [Candidatus Thermoplasmatota archaeon]
LDSSFLIDLLRGLTAARELAEELDASGEPAFIPAPALCEVRTGLLHRMSGAQAARFTAMLRSFTIVALDAAAAEKAAEIQADALAAGTAHGDVDAMIAGIAIVKGHALVTRDRRLVATSKRFGFEVRAY